MAFPYNFSDPYRHPMMGGAGGGRLRRFDELLRCYPIAMMSGPDRPEANHGGKIFLPASALDRLTRLHITYPMLFELRNGNAKKDGEKVYKKSHAGVLEFTAEEGRVYLPYWLMECLNLSPGDMLQILSTDLPPGNFIKLQPQSVDFLEISDPKAVLEKAFRNFSCLTAGDVFTFAYNDNVYAVAVLEVKPNNEKKAICTLETDLSVDFAPPVGYVEPERTSGTSTPRSVKGPAGGLVHAGQGSMAQAINYAAIAPSSNTAAAGARALLSNFSGAGNRLVAKKGLKTPTPNPSTPVAGTSTNPKPVVRKRNGAQRLRLPVGTLFFGYEIKPVKKKGENGDEEMEDPDKNFGGQGNSLRGKKK